jgi:hypothetical protein
VGNGFFMLVFMRLVFLDLFLFDLIYSIEVTSFL